MIKPGTVLLAAVLIAPFGLAVHDDLTTDRSSLSGYVEYDEHAGDQDDADELDGQDYRTFAGFAGALDEDEEQRIIDNALARVERQAKAAEGATQIATKYLGEARATLGPALAGIRFGAGADVALDGLGAELDPAAGYVSVLFAAEADSVVSGVRVIAYEHAGTRLLELLTERWGTPQIGDQSGHGFEVDGIWVSDDSRSRAVLRQIGGDLGIAIGWSMAPAELLDQKDKARLLASENKPLLGMRVAELESRYQHVSVDPYHGEYATSTIPVLATDPTAAQSNTIELRIDKKSSRVSRIDLELGCGSACAALESTLQSKYGDPTIAGPDHTGADDGDARIYGSSPRVRVQSWSNGQGLMVSFSR